MADVGGNIGNVSETDSGRDGARTEGGGVGGQAGTRSDSALDSADGDSAGGLIDSAIDATAEGESASSEICDGKDNNGDGRVDEGDACRGVQEPCPVGAMQLCDCWGGVHRKCLPNKAWSACKVDELMGSWKDSGAPTCLAVKVSSQSECKSPEFCDFGLCAHYENYPEPSNECLHHSDCLQGLVCDYGTCIEDPYHPDCDYQ